MVQNFIDKRYTEIAQNNPDDELTEEAHHFISRFGEHTLKAIEKVRNGSLYHYSQDQLFEKLEYILQEGIVNPKLCSCIDSTVNKINDKYICTICNKPIY